MTGSSERGEMRVNTVTVIAAAGCLALLVAAGVALALAGWETGAIIGLVSGLVAIVATALPLLDRAITVDRKQDAQTAQLTVITEQTNGGLDRRIATAVDSALAHRETPPERPQDAREAA